MKNKTIGLLLIITGLILMMVYLHIGLENAHLSTGYLTGVWIISAFFCVSGVCALFQNN